MRHRLKVFFTIGLIWLIFFQAARLIFMLYNFASTAQFKLSDNIMPLLLGIRMDLSMSSYWLIIPGLVMTAAFYLPDAISKWIIIVSYYLLGAFSAIIISADCELYKHWGYRLDTSPLFMIGKEAAGSVPITTIIGLILIFILLMTGLFFAMRIFIQPKLHFSRGTWKQALLMFFISALLFIPIRGGLGVAPLNTGVVYFHKTKTYPNHAGINVIWNFLKSVISDNSYRYPKNYLDAETTSKVFGELMTKKDSTHVVITSKKPNILLIILESFTAKIVEPLGGQPGVTPNLSKLAREGILFENFYASGDRTHKGLISILSAYPAQPMTSIIKYPNKTESLPYLPMKLKYNSYHPTFVYGGDVEFANIESYLNICGYTHITEDDDFDSNLNTAKWGVRDEFVFTRTLNELDTAQLPFFKTMLSLSSHEPYDVPGTLSTMSDMEKFLHSCSYTDSCLGNFINQAKKKDWWQNTLIIITADHGHRFPTDEPYFESARFKIPMLWIGGVIDSVSRNNKIGSQTDITTTLLDQLGITSNEFIFSKDLFSPSTSEFATYYFTNGYGYVSKQTEMIYDFDGKNFIKLDTMADPKEKLYGMAYTQMLFTDYNKR